MFSQILWIHSGVVSRSRSCSTIEPRPILMDLLSAHGKFAILFGSFRITRFFAPFSPVPDIVNKALAKRYTVQNWSPSGEEGLFCLGYAKLFMTYWGNVQPIWPRFPEVRCSLYDLENKTTLQSSLALLATLERMGSDPTDGIILPSIVFDNKGALDQQEYRSTYLSD